MSIVNQIRAKYEWLAPVMDERLTRLWAAAEAQALGHGGILTVTQATGILHKRICTGKRELQEMQETPPEIPARLQRVRAEGGGRKRLTETDPGLVEALDALIDPVTRGDPMSPLRWTCKSTRKLATALTEQGHPISASAVGDLLVAMDYSLQANEKAREGNQHPDRNAQFEYIARRTKAFQDQGRPVISVDAKKKELIGDFKNGGREWQPRGEPVRVRVHDFPDEELGKALPYGVYDVLRNEGWVSVGVDHDTAEFAVESILRWWRRMGRPVYPNATDLMITADGGGSNSSRSRLWKAELQRLAEQTGLNVHVCHYPPGTSKWNKIEHRMFSHITQNWRGRPLESLETVVQLIGATTTSTGLHIQAGLDAREYPKGLQVPDAELSAVNLRQARFHGDWNYCIRPR